MKILGIESSCDETSVAVISEGKLLSNLISSQDFHNIYGGVVPELSSRAHLQILLPLVKKSLQESGISLNQIDLVCATAGPGLIGALLVGLTFAKGLSYSLQKPFVPVNHIEGHIYSNWLGIEVQPQWKPQWTSPRLNLGNQIIFPVMCLIVSGGHTELILMKNHGDYELVGRTVDDAAGECFDKIARILGLPYPGGPAIAREAEKFNGKKWRYELPRPMLHDKTFDFSFAGLKTSALYLVKDLTSAPDAKKYAIRTIDRQYSLDEIRAPIACETQEAIVDVLVSKTLKAAEEYNVSSILVAGGVSANKRLRERLPSAHFPLLEYTTDNAAMICVAAYYNNHVSQNVEPDANWEIA